LGGGHVACDGGVSVLSGGRVGASEGRGDKGKGVRVLNLFPFQFGRGNGNIERENPWFSLQKFL